MSKRLHKGGVLAAATLCALAWPVAGAAQVTETSTIQNDWRYTVGGEAGVGSNTGGTTEVYKSVASVDGTSEMGLSLTGTLDNGNFFFLHNGVCVGQCSVTLSTVITFTLTNNSTQAVDLRFDSQITPGHLANAFLGTGSDSTAQFDFRVTDGRSPTDILYGAFGSANELPPFVFVTNQSQFNGFNINNNPPVWSVADWSATNLSVNVPTLGAGQSTTFTYASSLTIATFQSNCPDPAGCESFQVAFGDPRNAGGVINNSLAADAGLDMFAAMVAPLNGVSGQNPAVGALFDPFRVAYQFVPQGSPLPGQPPVIGPLPYDTPYRTLGVGAVPEPATWAMLVLGFGLVGSLLRRGRRRLAGTVPSLAWQRGARGAAARTAPWPDRSLTRSSRPSPAR